MVEFIKTCDQYPCKFNFGHIFSSVLFPHSAEKSIFQSTFLGEMGNFFLPGVVMIKTWRWVIFGVMSKQIQFFDSNVFSSNLNTINLKFFCNHGGIYRFEKKFKKYFGEINPLEVSRNIRGCILEINSEGLGW